MAIVRTTRYGGPGGAIVHICDDMLDGRSKEEHARMRGQVVYNMLAGQIARGITPTRHEVQTIPMSEREILYEKAGWRD